MNITKEEYAKWRKSLRSSGAWERWLFTIACNARAERKERGEQPLAHVHYAINHRAELWDDITRHARDGKVGYVRSGMDCDCTQYRYEGVIDLPAGALIHQREVDHHEQYLDGPENTWYRDPGEEVRTYRSADRALEAYEDGHPHSVSWGSLEVA